MDKETLARLADFFSPAELVELLGVSVDDLLEAFEAEVEDALEDLEEIMEYRND